MEIKVYQVVGWENTDSYSSPNVSIFEKFEDAYDYMLKGYENTKTQYSDESRPWASINKSGASVNDGFNHWYWEIREIPLNIRIFTAEKSKKAMRCLNDNGTPADEAFTELQALGYILADEELEDVLPEDVAETGWRYARYHTYWDDGTEIVSDCKVDRDTKKVFDIECGGSASDDASCIEEAISLAGKIKVRRVIDLDEIINCNSTEDVLEELQMMKENNSYWRTSEYEFDTLDEAIEKFKI